MAATWTNIADTFLEPGKPVRSVDGLALRDNPIAIAEGVSGAPRVQTAAINNGAVTNAKVSNSTLGAEKFQTGTTERNWVLARTAAASAGAVGTYAFCRAGARDGTSSFTNPGTTQPGGNLNYSNPTGTSDGASPSGVWRQMGYALRRGSVQKEDPEAATLWLRIS